MPEAVAQSPPPPAAAAPAVTELLPSDGRGKLRLCNTAYVRGHKLRFFDGPTQYRSLVHAKTGQGHQYAVHKIPLQAKQNSGLCPEHSSTLHLLT
jgi:hypothetical protein